MKLAIRPDLVALRLAMDTGEILLDVLLAVFTLAALDGLALGEVFVHVVSRGKSHPGGRA